MTTGEQYDLVVVGGGPAGLASAIFAARKGKRTVLIEKESRLDQHPRGETLHHHPVLDELLGDGVMESLTLSETALREFYAPDPFGSERITIQRETPSIVFEWSPWIKAFESAMENLDIELLLQAEVVDVVEIDGLVTGVVYRDSNGMETTVSGKAVLACDGHQSVIGRKYGIQYASMNFPFVKSILKNADFENPGFKYFFVPADSLEYAPGFPPSIIFLFPRDGKNCEAGLLVMANSARELGMDLPDTEELLTVWETMKKRYPLFKDMLKNADTLFQETTALPMTGSVENVVPRKGVVLLGDAAGFVEISGGSGLVSSLRMAKYWTEKICDALDRIDDPEVLWRDEAIERFNREFRESELSKHISEVAERNTASRKYLFVELNTRERMMENWELLRKMIMGE
ncbi:MAG: NAD(P)/FAD-dependent oxidoreductase [Deltaproteobacteria bacterium]|nr:NAD(P)/FAD-dependent oxidoreductase [Deltaproteobacteria bacterium]